MATLTKAAKYLSSLRQTSKGCFTQIFYQNLEVLDCKDETLNKQLILNFRTNRSLRNSINTLHGGAIASLLDVASILAVKTFQREGSTPVATHINIDYFKSGKLDQDYKVEVTVLKAGKFLSFSRSVLLDLNGAPMAQSSVVTKNLAQIKESSFFG